MNAIKKLLENKYVAWWKKPVIRVFTEPFYTLMDFAVFYFVCVTQSWWVGGLAVIWILLISPILVATKENLDKLEENKQDEHSQL